MSCDDKTPKGKGIGGSGVPGGFNPLRFTTPFDFGFEYDATLRVIEEIEQKVHEPFVLDTSAFSNHFLAVYYRDQYSLERAIYEILGHAAQKDNIYEIADAVCERDEEWNAWRNQGYLVEAYLRYRLKPEYAQLILDACAQWREQIETLRAESQEKQAREKAEREARFGQFKALKVYKKIEPGGGRDGYWDGVVADASGNEVRMVARNVFDFGYYVYPKRVEGTDGVIFREGWTELEQKACNWLNEFPPISDHFRM